MDLGGIEVVHRTRILPSSAYVILDGLSELLLDTKFDVIHIHGYGEYAGDLACILRKVGKLQTPILLTTHGIAGLRHALGALNFSLKFGAAERLRRAAHLFYDESMGRLEMKTFDKVVILSSEEKHYLRKIGLQDNRVVSIPVAVNDIFHESVTLSRQEYVLYVGRIDRHKGLSTLVHAIKELKDSGCPMKCVVIGDDFGYKTELEHLVETLDLRELVEIRNPVSQEALIPIFSSALATILLSSAEGLPTSLIESISIGIPFISTPVGGISELASSSKAGILVSPNEPREVAQAIIKINTDRSLWNSMSSSGKAYASSFTWTRVANQYLDLYEELSRKC
jgi:glycosyltransferase involved in cell wall biosynthesis